MNEHQIVTVVETKVTASDLERQGFSPEEIERLEELRTTYNPFHEMFDHQQWERLRFMKWMYDTRRQARG